MGYYGKIAYKLRAQQLRKKGLSYKEILQLIPVSKDTISRWCRDIQLTHDQIQRLESKRKIGGIRGALLGAKKQQNIRVQKTEELLNIGIKNVGELSKRERFIAGIALYAAEGTKKDGKCEFTNSNPMLIHFMTNWFREFCHISNSRLRGAIWIHRNLDAEKAKEYWSLLTGVPHSQFHKTYIASNKTHSKKIRKNIHSFGIFSIRFTDVKIHRTLMGWIAGMLKTSWYN